MLSATLLARYPLVSDQVTKAELAVILHELETVLERGTTGDVVEFGCYKGTTSLFLQRLVMALDQTKTLHVYDSFAGLPPKVQADNSAAGDQFKAGELAVTKKDLIREFQKAHLRPPVIHKGWFAELNASDMPSQIAFAYLDGDFYESILDSLKLVWPRLQPGGVVCIDDYNRPALPGVTRAVSEFFGGRVVEHSQSIAIIRN